MTTNLAGARSLARRDRRPSRNRDREVAGESASRSQTNRSSRDDEEPSAKRIEERRSRYRNPSNHSPRDDGKCLSSRRSARRRSRSTSTDANENDSPDRYRRRTRKSFDISDRRNPATRAEVSSRTDPPGDRSRSYRKTESHNSSDKPSYRMASSKRDAYGGVTSDLPSQGLSSSKGPGSGVDSSLRSSRRGDSRTRKQVDGAREKAKVLEESRSKTGGIQSSQCMIENDQDDPLANIAASVLRSEEDKAKKLAEQEQARKVAERAAIRERRRLERERLEKERSEREREIAEKAAEAAEKIELAKKAANKAEAAEKAIAAAGKAQDDTEGRRDRTVSLVEAVEVTGEPQSVDRDSSSGKSKSLPRRKPGELTSREDDPVKSVQTPRRTLVVRDSTIPADANAEDRVILVSANDDEGAKAKKPSDYKREASNSFVRKKSVNLQAVVEITSPRQSTNRSAKMEKTTSSPFKPCPGFSGVAGSNELIKALAFRRQKTMGTEKAYHATGNNANLLADDRLVKTGSISSDDKSLSEGGPRDSD